MSLGEEMFAIAPASGSASLSETQKLLLTSKAWWVYQVAERGFPTIPSIAITRRAWVALQEERKRGESALRSAWVATLFRLVGRDGVPPRLVARPSVQIYESDGGGPPLPGVSPPQSEEESVDPARPLGRALRKAFETYGPPGPPWTDQQGRRYDEHLVIVQAYAPGELVHFLSRDADNGALGPAQIGRKALPNLPDDCDALSLLVDQIDGVHAICLVAVEGDIVRFLSAHAMQVMGRPEVEAAVDRVRRQLWTEQHAVSRISPYSLQQMLHPRLDPDHKAEPIAHGLGVSPGAASGIIVFTAEDAARVRARGRHCILVVNETGPADIEGMTAATGILTARGGMTSHAAVIARITGKPCVAGVRSLQVNAAEMTCRIGSKDFRSGDRITIDGSDGSVYLGALSLSQPHIGGALGTLLGWSDMSRRIEVRTNVETVEAAKVALSFGAEGIGLARSEHMFFAKERMVALRRLILSEDEDDRREALTGLVDYQTGDYAALFATMQGRPVTVRLFDPPLHEFLPRGEEDIAETARSLGFTTRALQHRLERLAEVNPMLGHRGVRLAVTYPEILEMQMQALLAGVAEVTRRQTQAVVVEIMVPFVSTASEVAWVRDRVTALIEQSGLERSGRALFSFGTMIELPRAALRAGDIAANVDFFSFGTNDLTQTTFGISRDDAPAFLAAYQRKGLYAQDPFVTIDQKGVGELIAMAISRGKAANPRLKIGICGEHAGDPESLKFFASLDVDYISCSPYRVPVARLTLAQTAR